MKKLGAVALAAVLVACSGEVRGSTSTSDVIVADHTVVLWVDSYHPDYEWSGEIEQGLASVFDTSETSLIITRMDTKRNTDPGWGDQAAIDVLRLIEAHEPDVIIATDDNAQKFLVVPHLEGGDIPVVFAGVNWDATKYGYPTETVTGMIEVDLVDRLIDLLAPYAAGRSIGYLTGDSETERNVVAVYNERFFDGRLEASFVSDYAAFKTEFLRMQARHDMLYVGNNAAIEGWNDREAEAFVLANTRIPTGSHNAWMAPFVLMAEAKYGQEQGEWAAQTALEIIDGATPSDIPIVANTRGRLIVNPLLADRLGILLTPTVLRNAQIHLPGASG